MSKTDDDVPDLPADSEFGSGEEEEEIEEEEEEEEDRLTIYDAETFISGPFQSEQCTIPEDILEFYTSFGYDCRRYFNLCVPDPDNLVFASGNFINFFNVSTREVTYRRSALGGGIGHIKNNPNPEILHLAVAENAFHHKPLIIVYEWPSLEINCVLKEGSSKTYTNIDYSPDGMLLASQGGEPDYLITVWNWPKRRILLRTKSYVNDVHRIKFSPYCPGQLTTGGIAHIKFWKMASTFTGLKLKGEVGRFGKTEYSDILGVLPMPDEKVLSGSSWGNILVWDGGLIKLEVFRTLRRKCHEAPIVQIHFDEGELWTVGMDGHIRVWWYEKIDQADPPDDDRVVQIEPTYDFYTEGLMLMCLRKRYPDPLDAHYFAQDGNGGIWYLDLNTEEDPEAAVQLFKCHAGQIRDIATCPWGPYVVSIGSGGKFFCYNYLLKKLVFTHQFLAAGRRMIWAPSMIAPNCDELILGFDDGTVRVCIFTIKEDDFQINLTQMTKPHNKPITQMVLNKNCDVLVTGGEDATIFVFQVTNTGYVRLVPIGYVSVPTEVTYLTWHLTHTEEVLVGCLRGELMQIRVPNIPQDYTTVSLLLDVEIQQNKFKTYKAQIRRNIKIAEIEARKEVKVEKKRVELEKLKKENPGLDIDEEVFLADSETEEELEPLHIPEVPNKVLWIQNTPENTLWLSMGGYDAGYVYEYNMKQTSEVPEYFRMVDDADDVEISNFIYNYNEKYLIFAMQDGTIRINKKQENKSFREDLSNYWTLAMHENLNGFVPRMCFSYDEKFFFSCGLDNNLFAYRFFPEEEDYIPDSQYAVVSERSFFPQFIPDEDNYKTLSLEEHSLKVEQDRIDALANANKKILKEKLHALAERFSKVIDQNAALLPSQQLTMAQLELDARVTQDLDDKLEAKLALVKRKLAYDVEKAKLGMEKLLRHFLEPLDFYPIRVKQMNKPLLVEIRRQRKIAEAHWKMLEVVEEKILEAELKGRPPERAQITIKPPPPKKLRDKTLEYFLINLTPSVIEMKLGAKLTRLLTKYRERKLKWEHRDDVWEEFMDKKPVPGVNHPEDEAALAEAKKNIGDYKLKSASNYKATRETQETTVKKYKQLLLTRIRQFTIRHDYNQKIFDQRTKKQKLREELAAYQQDLRDIHEEIPNDRILEIPTFEAEDPGEFPEKNLEITDALIMEDFEPSEPPIVVIPEYSPDFAEKAAILIKQVRRYDYESVKPLVAKVNAVPTMDFESWFLKTANSDDDTPFEAVIRVRRLWRKLFDQEQIFHFMNEKIDMFNEEIQDLYEEHYEVHVAGTFMDLHVLELHQELIVLKDFESLEDALQEKVNQRMTDVLDMQDAIKTSLDDMRTHESNIMRLSEQCAELGYNFQQTMSDNKFFTFLRRVWKKKYKVAKIRTGDESSSSESSSSSSSSEEEDTGSIDSRDFGIIKLDLNVCPKGCDPAMFELTINLRTQRHEKELKIKDEQKKVEEVKKTMEFQHKKIKLLEHSLKLSEDDLEKYQHEKQKKLNEIHCTVMLRLHQIQHMTPEGKTSNILDTLVFSKTLLSKLYKRVDELVGEKVAQNALHAVNVKHLTRMTTDCKYMRKKIHKLKQDIIELMRIKFGHTVEIEELEEAILRRTLGQKDLNDLEEVVMRKLVTKLRLSLMDVKGLYAEEIKLWRDNVDKVQQELVDTLRDNTSRKDLLAVLSKEKSELLKFIHGQDKKNEHLDQTLVMAKDSQNEIKKLEAILCDQCRQIQELKDEIKVLKTKGYPPKPVRRSSVEPVEELMEPQWEFEEFVGKLDYDEYEYVGEEEMVKPFGRTISIPALLDERSETIATELVTEMLYALDLAIEKKSDENFIKQIVSSVMVKVSIEDMIEELIRLLPIEPDDDQIGIIEATAEQLFTIEDVEEDNAPGDLLESIVDDVIISTEGPTEMLSELVKQLYDNLPLEFILKKDSMEVIAERIINAHLDAELDKKELMTAAINDEMKIIMSEILNTVYGIGIDYLYYID